VRLGELRGALEADGAAVGKRPGGGALGGGGAALGDGWVAGGGGCSGYAAVGDKGLLGGSRV